MARFHFEHRFIAGNGRAYTAFIDAFESEWRVFEEAGANNLESLRPSIHCLVEGHAPSDAEIATAQTAFASRTKGHQGR